MNYDEGKKLNLKYNMLFFECSAKMGKILMIFLMNLFKK